MADINGVTLCEVRDAIARGEWRAADVVDAYLGRIEKHGHPLNVFEEVYTERARDRAKDVDAGRLTGPLAGVVVAVKDNMCTDWGHTTCSSRMLADFEAPYTCTAVAKLEAAGAIVIGKSVMDEFAMGSSTETATSGATHNPWDPERVPGGSSGGSAAAVAADLCAGALGSDTGGSIRQPAALCGVVGMKPTYGRVSRWGLVAFASSLDQIGPFGHSVADVAAVLGVISGHDPRDSTSADVPVPPYEQALAEDPGTLRIGLAKQYLSDANGPAVAAAVQGAVDRLKEAGAQIVQVDLPHTEYGIPTYYIVATAEASSNLARYDGVHYGHRTDKDGDLVSLYSLSREEGFGDEVKRRIMLGTYVLSSGYYDAYYVRALKARRLIRNDFDQAFTRCDAILCPTTTAAAFPIGQKMDDPIQMYMNDVYTVGANLAGIPGISLPGGFDVQGDNRRLPVGIQLLGPPFGETRLLQIAAMLESVCGLNGSRPALT